MWNVKGVKELIAVLNNSGGAAITVERAVQLCAVIGIEAVLTADIQNRTQQVRIWTSATAPEKTAAYVGRPDGIFDLILQKQRVGEDVWVYEGTFEWPMEKFCLTLRFNERDAAVQVFGPYSMKLAQGYLKDGSIGVGVPSLGAAIVELLTDERTQFEPSIGAGDAKDESDQASETLLRLVAVRSAGS